MELLYLCVGAHLELGRVEHDGIHSAGDLLDGQFLEQLGGGLELHELLHRSGIVPHLLGPLPVYPLEGTGVAHVRIDALEGQRLRLEEHDQEVAHGGLELLQSASIVSQEGRVPGVELFAVPAEVQQLQHLQPLLVEGGPRQADAADGVLHLGVVGQGAARRPTRRGRARLLDLKSGLPRLRSIPAPRTARRLLSDCHHRRTRFFSSV
mmetsp:Transcript_9683/g.21495  ORF Transcript_9683/g.21495 Transcript_9683/m.21495 type:complete len:208 (-) Transcript_9683:865-1488(-)